MTLFKWQPDTFTLTPRDDTESPIGSFHIVDHFQIVDHCGLKWMETSMYARVQSWDFES